jgi:AmmeMemoRadiSam system protein B
MAATVRPARFAGRWYPASSESLTATLDEYLSHVEPVAGDVRALVSPHAGLMYSGHIAAYGYRAAAGRRYDVAVLVGPSHYAAFDGVAIAVEGAFETPLGAIAIDDELAARLAEDPLVTVDPGVHAREHSLELQLPFLARVLPGVPIVPLLIGDQEAGTARALADLLASTLTGRTPLLVASSDLSHYYPRDTAARLDGAVLECLDSFDAGALETRLAAFAGHACGGGAIVAVMRTAAALGATESRVVRYGDSGEVSGDLAQVVGYVSAVLGRFARRAGAT